MSEGLVLPHVRHPRHGFTAFRLGFGKEVYLRITTKFLVRGFIILRELVLRHSLNWYLHKLVAVVHSPDDAADLLAKSIGPPSLSNGISDFARRESQTVLFQNELDYFQHRGDILRLHACIRRRLFRVIFAIISPLCAGHARKSFRSRMQFRQLGIVLADQRLKAGILSLNL